MASEASHRVLYSSEDYSVFQLSLLLSHLQLADRVTAELSSLDESAKGMQLSSASGVVSTRSAVFHELAALSSVASLRGSTNEETALIGQWSDFAWHRLGKLVMISVTLRKCEFLTLCWIRRGSPSTDFLRSWKDGRIGGFRARQD